MEVIKVTPNKKGVATFTFYGHNHEVELNKKGKTIVHLYGKDYEVQSTEAKAKAETETAADNE